MVKKKIQILIALRQRGITQCELCQHVGNLSESKLSRIINGFYTPSKKEATNIANVLNKTLKDLGLEESSDL